MTRMQVLLGRPQVPAPQLGRAEVGERHCSGGAGYATQVSTVAKLRVR
jgi:hypothetical protein